MDVWSALLIAVGGAIIWQFLKWLWQTLLPDLFRPFQKSEPNIAGTWKSSFIEEETPYTETVKVEQSGRNIKATITLKDEDEDITYKFTGTFQHLILSGTYVSTDNDNFERGTILLRLKKQGKTFVGQTSYISKTSEELVSSAYEWTRQ